MPRHNWTRAETLVAFNLYCRTPFGRLHARNPDIIEVANALERTPGALAMKCCNLAAFDEALRSRGIRGLRKASRMDEEVWRQFERDPESIAFESEQVLAEVTRRELPASGSAEWEDVQGLDRAAITRVRVNQNFFRSLVLAGYESRCAICNLPFRPLLVASHIVPWSVDASLRMNPRNGICLCSLHDKAFDRGLMLIGADYSISVPDGVEEAAIIPSVAANFLSFVGKKLRLPDRWRPDPGLLERHSALARSLSP